MTRLEEVLPVGDFTERHSRWIAAEPAAVWRALTELTLHDLPMARPLVAIRHLGRPTPRGRSLFSDGPVRMLEIDPGRYAVGGAVARPWQRHPQRREVGSLREFAAFAEPGWAKYLADFALEERAGGVQLTTVTRGVCTDRAAWRRMRPYWALIRPASGLIRREMLAAVERRATRPVPPVA